MALTDSTSTPFDYTEDPATVQDLGQVVELFDIAVDRAFPDLEVLKPRQRRRRRGSGSVFRRVLLSIGALALTASIAGLATYGTFTSATSASHTVTTGTVTVALGATGAVTNRLNVNATNVAPGDTMQRTVDVINSSSLALASTTLTTTASPSSVLDTDTTNGLQLVIERCSVPWTEAGISPAFTYTCGGTTTNVVASRPIIGANIALSNMTLAAGGGTDHLHITLTLPAAAGNTFQGVTSTTTFAFTGTQRAATNS